MKIIRWDSLTFLSIRPNKTIVKHLIVHFDTATGWTLIEHYLNVDFYPCSRIEITDY